MGYGPVEAERERIAAYLDAQAETHRAEAQAPGTLGALRDRRSNYVVALETVARDIRDGAHLRGEESMITQHTINKGMMQNCIYMARKQGEADVCPDDGPVYDFYLEDGRVGNCQGPSCLENLAAFGQAMIVQQRPGTGTLLRGAES